MKSLFQTVFFVAYHRKQDVCVPNVEKVKSSGFALR